MNYIEFKIEYVVILLMVLILYLMDYIMSKESQHSKNMRSVATVVEELSRDVFYLKKELIEAQKNAKDFSTRMSDEEIYQEIERGVYDMLNPISRTLEQMQENINAIDAQIDSRIASIESGVKQISMPSSLNANDDEKIISLFKQGVPLETISRELHLSKPEVEFVLKINKIK